MSLALITGASKGIGQAIAEELAGRNVNVLLVARSRDLLEAACRQLSSRYGITADYLAIDLAIPGATKQIYDWCVGKSYTPDILINNAGFGLSGLFSSHTLQEEQQVMQVNMQTTVELSHLFLPLLQQRPRSYIMNIASQAAFQAVPGLNVYAASKAFVRSFSHGLRYELRKTNVSVTLVCPGPTATHFAHAARVGTKAMKAAERFNMQPQKVAALAIRAMYAGKKECTTGFINKLGQFFVWLLPAALSEKTAAGIYEV